MWKGIIMILAGGFNQSRLPVPVNGTGVDPFTLGGTLLSIGLIGTGLYFLVKDIVKRIRERKENSHAL